MGARWRAVEAVPIARASMTPEAIELLRALVAQAPPAREALRVGEAARALGVSEDYFSAKIAPNLRMVRDGRTKLVPVSELRRWLDRHAARAVAPR